MTEIIENTSEEHEIDVLEIIKFLFKNSLMIGLFSISTAILFGLYSYKLTDQFKSETIVIPTESSSGSNLGSLGSLASFAGVSMSKGPNQTQIALAVLDSRSFLVNFIEKNKLQETIFPNDWDKEEGRWMETISKDDIADTFKDIFSVSNSQDIYSISVEWRSPHEASLWANLLVKELNLHMQSQAIKEYQENIGFLRDELKTNNVKEIENVLFKQIEEQTKNIMIANVKNEYIFKVLDPAIKTIHPHSPNRIRIVFLGLVIGLIIGSIVISTYSYFFRNSKLIRS